MKLRFSCVIVVLLSFALAVSAQTVDAGLAATTQVPRLIQFSNVATDEGGNSMSGMVRITFSLYTVQRGGEPLWTETQNVQLDATGHYSVQLGITKPGGMAANLFTTGQARWLGIQIAEQAAQPRVLLMSVPYALKAGDAETIGGLPASAFVLAAPYSGGMQTADENATSSSSTPPPPASAVTTSGGSSGKLPLWDGATDITNSVIVQSGSGSTAKVGIGTSSPASTLDVKGTGTVRGTLSLPATAAATSTAGKRSQALNLAASAFNSSTSTAVNQNFRWQAEPVNNDTSTASGSLNLLFGQGTSTPAETGLSIANNGQITFATGQTFPGTGTGNGSVTSVSSGTGLTGGPITTSGTLSIDPSVVPEKATNNTFTGIQTFSNNNIFNGNQAFNGFNTFTGDQTFNGNITSNQIVSAQTLSAANGGVTGSFLAGSISTGPIGGSTISTTGSVGIGLSADTFPLHVNGDMRGEGGFFLGGNGLVQVDAPGIPGGRLTVLANGNVGINKASPAATLDVNGTVNATGKVSGPNGVSLPIAYGTINANGTVSKATSNVSVSWDATNKWYAITITGVSYNFALFATQVTATFSTLVPQVTANVSSVSGNLLVQLHDTAGNAIQNPFQFVTFGF